MRFGHLNRWMKVLHFQRLYFPLGVWTQTWEAAVGISVSGWSFG
jgi:hypothetical protein